MKHYKLILHWWFEVLCNKHESNITTIRLSHSIFREIGMKLGESKCAYMVIEKGEIIEHVGPIVMNDVIVNPMKTGECYKYLWKNIRKEWKTSGQVNCLHITSILLIMHLLLLSNIWYSQVNYTRDRTHWNTNQKNGLYECDWELLQKFLILIGYIYKGSVVTEV